MNETILLIPVALGCTVAGLGFGVALGAALAWARSERALGIVASGFLLGVAALVWTWA